ncbi:MAG: hypothetical protein V8Q28_06585 [Alistipes sp.]
MAFAAFRHRKAEKMKKSFFLVLLRPKVPKASARRFPREGARRGAARGAQDQAYALPRDGRAAARTLFFRVKRECGFVVPPLAAKDMIKINTFRQRVLFFTPQGDSRLGSDGGKADGGLKARAAGTVCLQTRAVARRRFQTSGRRHRNRSGGFCCFSPSKSREKVFYVLLGPKVPKASARRFPRECASRGAARGAQDQAYAPPRGGRAAARPLFFRVKRECGFIVPPTAALYGMRPAFFLPARRSPTWFRWRESGRKTESASGGDGLLANPRSRPTPLSAFRTPTSESVGWLLLLFAIEKQRKSFLCTFGAKSTKSLRTSFSAGVREPRRCTGRARSGLCATPWRTRRSSPPSFFRVKRECGFIVPPTAAFFILFGNAPRHSFPARRFPTWFRWRKSGRRTESESGGDGLLANPRSRPTPLSAFRPPASESVGWLLLLFAIEKQVKKKKFSARRPKIAKGFRENFCCFSLLKSSKKKKWRGADNR